MSDYPRSSGTSRRFHIWDAGAGRALPWRYYSTSKRAQEAAIKMIHWAKIGVTLEVYNAAIGKLVRQYTRKVTTISIWPPLGD